MNFKETLLREFSFIIFGFHYIYSKHKVFQVFPGSDFHNMFMSMREILYEKKLAGKINRAEYICANLASICTCNLDFCTNTHFFISNAFFQLRLRLLNFFMN